jgi:hypothetical protein
MSNRPLHVCICCVSAQALAQAPGRAFCSIGYARHLEINSLSGSPSAGICFLVDDPIPLKFG